MLKLINLIVFRGYTLILNSMHVLKSVQAFWESGFIHSPPQKDIKLLHEDNFTEFVCRLELEVEFCGVS